MALSPGLGAEAVTDTPRVSLNGPYFHAWTAAVWASRCLPNTGLGLAESSRGPGRPTRVPSPSSPSALLRVAGVSQEGAHIRLHSFCRCHSASEPLGGLALVASGTRSGRCPGTVANKEAVIDCLFPRSSAQGQQTEAPDSRFSPQEACGHTLEAAAWGADCGCTPLERLAGALSGHTVSLCLALGWRVSLEGVCAHRLLPRGHIPW